MNETMGNIIMRLRKEHGLTQEQLANALGISYQAVSKWETGNSCPDIATLPLLADLFSVSIDALFDRAPAETEALSVPGDAIEPAGPEACDLPWLDDDSFYAVLYHGHTLIDSQAENPRALRAQQSFRFEYEGPAQNVFSIFDVEIDGPVSGDVEAGGDVNCDSVGGGVCAEGDVNCDSVGGAVNAGGDVSCDEVCGNIRAGGDVSCGDVTGSVSAGGDLNCEQVRGAAFSGGTGRFGSRDDLEEELGNLGDVISEKLSGLGDTISDAVEKSMKKSWSFHKVWPFGKHEIHVDLDLERDEDTEE